MKIEPGDKKRTIFDASPQELAAVLIVAGMQLFFIVKILFF